MTPEKDALRNALILGTGDNLAPRLLDRIDLGERTFFFVGATGVGKTFHTLAAKNFLETRLPANSRTRHLTVHHYHYDEIKSQVATEFIDKPDRHQHISFKKYRKTLTEDEYSNLLLNFYLHNLKPKDLSDEDMQIWNGNQKTLFIIVTNRVEDLLENDRRSGNIVSLADVNYVKDTQKVLKSTQTFIRQRVLPPLEPGSHSRATEAVDYFLLHYPQITRVFFFINTQETIIKTTINRSLSSHQTGALPEEALQVIKQTGAGVSKRTVTLLDDAQKQELAAEILTPNKRTGRWLNRIDLLQNLLSPDDLTEIIHHASWVDMLFENCQHPEQIDMVFSLELYYLAKVLPDLGFSP